MSRGYALVTGASRGIGAALAAALAAEGYDLILTARSVAALEAQRERLGPTGRHIHVIAADLAQGGAAQVLEAVAANAWPVTLLVNNAGVGSRGEFAALPAAREIEQVRLNIEATVALTHGLLMAMKQRRAGAIINVASIAALQPVPYLATYAATKAFMLHFSLALRDELRGSGVCVMALCPGPTRTDFFATAGSGMPMGLQSPEAVAAAALRGLRKRKSMVISQSRFAVQDAIGHLLPRQAKSFLAGKMIQSWPTLPTTSR